MIEVLRFCDISWNIILKILKTLKRRIILANSSSLTIIEGFKMRRIYVGKNEIPRVLDGLGISILSTSKGVISNKTAKRIGVGGEILCKVW